MFKYIMRVVEIQTKVASVIPFLYTTLFLEYNDVDIDYKLLFLFFISMLCLDMAVTAMNTIYGINHEEVDTKDNRHLSNFMNEVGVDNRFNYTIVIILLLIFLSSAIYLTLNSSIIFFLIGSLCFFIAITYSFGPFPTCSTPLGELLSGTAMGLFIPMLIIELTTNIISFYLINLNLYNLIDLVIAFLPLVFTIAAIMLTNNIVDIEEDELNKRYTLVHYLKVDKSIILLRGLYLFSAISIIISTILNIIPLIMIISTPLYIKIIKELSIDIKKINSVKAFIKLNLLLIILFIFSILF